MTRTILGSGAGAGRAGRQQLCLAWRRGPASGLPHAAPGPRPAARTDGQAGQAPRFLPGALVPFALGRCRSPGAGAGRGFWVQPCPGGGFAGIGTFTSGRKMRPEPCRPGSRRPSPSCPKAGFQRPRAGPQPGSRRSRARRCPRRRPLLGLGGLELGCSPSAPATSTGEGGRPPIFLSSSILLFFFWVSILN